jgi:tetratricopeptide (TPR) repeat protein
MPVSFPPVFLSYARGTSRLHAQRLHEALGGEAAGLCFLDTSDLESGDRLPETLVDALLDARVVVAFATPRYFQRWYCQLEFGVARMPSLHLHGAGEAERARALDGLVIALPGEGADEVADWLPPDARVTAWPAEGETEALAALVRARLAADPPTYRERLAAFTDPRVERERLRDASRLPRAPGTHAVLTVAPPGLSPSIGDAFVGRADDLWRIHAALGAGGGAAGLTGSIEAAGGMGKTRLALEYFHRLGPVHFAGGLFWISAHDDPDPQLRRVLDAVDPAAPSAAELQALGTTISEAVREAFRKRGAGGPPALFVVDNVPEPGADDSPPPLQAWCPALGEPGVAVLATSRMRVEAPGAAVSPVSIGVLDPAAAVRLLAPPGEHGRLSEDEWREVAAWVGHLPLALELLRAALHHGAVSPGELLEQSRDQSPTPALDAARSALRRQIPDKHLPGITAAFAISYDRLERDAQTAARMLAWLAPAPVPSLLVEEIPLRFFSPEARAALVSRHFVVRPEGSSAAFFGTMHRVLADFLRRRKDPEWDLRALLDWGMSEMLRDAADDGELRIRLVRAFAQPGAAVLAAVEAHGLEGDALEDAVSFGGALFLAADEEGQVAIARTVGDRLLPLIRRLHGDDDDETLGFVRRLVVVYGAAGDLERARDFAAEHAEALRGSLGDVHPEVLALQMFEAFGLADEGRYDEADERLEALLGSTRAELGEGHELTLMLRAMVAFMLSLRGRPAEAVPLLQAVLSDATEGADPDAGEVLVPRLLLEMSRLQDGNAPERPAEIRDLARAARATFGAHNPFSHLAGQLEQVIETMQTGQAETSAELRELLVTLREAYGPDHHLVFNAERRLARELENEGDHDGALATAFGVVEGVRRLKGERSMDALNADVWRGAMLRRMGRLDEARTVHQAALASFEAEFGAEHPDTIDAMKSLALTLRAAKDYAGTQQLQERVLALYHQTLGEHHPHTFDAAVDVFDTATKRHRILQAYRVASPWVPFLMGVPADRVPADLVTVQQRLNRLYPMPGLVRRRMWKKLLEVADESPPPRRRWWKFW